ncbi:Peptide chain release factor 2 [Fundidesulfovibrio magnetotacticus]|uniref:Peptide chain release factor 2 n=1 Tax=Fundidesulfovibrio magnetotacticus TaxID=2730080 RepID=A0A6V8LTV1_9BACT|nr:Peptide chain release factor 2 [Fundidesulfovibrio magnetotacticus]
MGGKTARLAAIEAEISKPDAWQNPERMTPFLREKSDLTAKVERCETLQKAREDLDEWLAMAQEDQNPEVLQELFGQLATLGALVQEAELATLLSGPEDASGAILEIHPGAGGTEAQDWAEMLLRLYRRWCERHNFTVDELDFLPGDEAGVKSVTLQVNGPYAYGFLKAEKGIHRLIRISPFDSSGRRHTSFASVDVYPDAGADIQIEVKDEDIRVDVFRASGPGGQHVNKTSSAIRITHMPSGIVVQCQNEKSQHRNRESAMKVLKARLYDLELGKQQALRQAEYQSKDAIGFGSQIRTYTLQPYRLVKDHRTGCDAGDVEAVLDGDIDTFIRQYLLHYHA